MTGLLLRELGKNLGGRTVVDGLSLEVARGELVCLLGPSGCGKTTTLRMIGGFLPPDSGSVQINGTDVTRTPPERRPTSMVFQNYALWPHMTVFKNISYGLRLRKLPKTEIRERVEKTLELVNLTHHLASYPAQISGGEQQRVALARALVLEPEVLLLDEPLSNLDAKLRVKVREDIKEIQQRVGITTVFVTHDQDEALSISDRIAVMNNGRIEQYADPHVLYREPATRFVADFIGAMNFLDGTATDSVVDIGVKVPAGSVSLAGQQSLATPLPSGGSLAPTGPLPPTRPLAPTGTRVVLAIRPEDVRVSAAAQVPADVGVFSGLGAPARVLREVPRGHYTELLLSIGDAKVRAFVGGDFVGGTEEVAVTFARVQVFSAG